MEIETKVISIEIIKPSSPTPKSLQKHNLSILDQSMPPIYIPFVYYYASNPQIPNSQKSKQLKKSLSEVLSRFYPLAGRHVDNLYVDCNDDGAPFFEAEADCDLSQAMPHANTKVLSHLLPYKMDELQDFCMAVQATYFRCGGLALAILISHKLADARSSNLFVNTWSAVARNEGGGVPLPEFDAAAHFPPLQDTSVLEPTAPMTTEEISTRIFTFPAAAVSLLQERYSVGSERPSRTAALSAFMWTQYVTATGTRSDPNKIFMMMHAVDIRRRVDPPLSKYHFGNMIGASTVQPVAGDGGAELVRKIREAVKAVNSGYVVYKNDSERMKSMMEMMVFLQISSLCGFPLYEADFGWGRPIWVGLAQFTSKHLIYFMDAKSEGGIEVFIHLPKQEMEKFGAHFEPANVN